MHDMDAHEENDYRPSPRRTVRRRAQRRGPVGTVFCVALAVATALGGNQGRVASSAEAAKWAPSRKGTDPGAVHTLRSPHFRLHTDLAPADGRLYLKRAETTLRRVQQYWQRPLRGKIECYLVHDLARWPADRLPHPQAAVLLRRVGGGIDQQPVTAGRQTTMRAIVYAMAQPGILEHEVVHAYCLQTFGRGGPDWYKEGMAQQICISSRGRDGVQGPAEVMAYLRKSEIREIEAVVSGDDFTAPITASFSRIAQETLAMPRGHGDRSSPSWQAKDETALRKAKESYYWSWALCHLLNNNPTYRRRFRLLGAGMLHGYDVDFDKAFGPVADRLAFEYRFFVARCRPGYRVDLCRWDWRKRFARLDGATPCSVRIRAAFGYQATGIHVTRGTFYRHTTSGTWKTETAGPPTTCAGREDGRGCLVGVVMYEEQLEGGAAERAGGGVPSGEGKPDARSKGGLRYALSEPFELGEHGMWTVPVSGSLYVRCRDGWGALADNEGTVTMAVAKLPANP